MRKHDSGGDVKLFSLRAFIVLILLCCLLTTLSCRAITVMHNSSLQRVHLPINSMLVIKNLDYIAFSWLLENSGLHSIDNAREAYFSLCGFPMSLSALPFTYPAFYCGIEVLMSPLYGEPPLMQNKCTSALYTKVSEVKSLLLIPSITLAPLNQRKNIMVLAVFNDGGVCDATLNITWTLTSASAWNLGLSVKKRILLLLQAQLGPVVSNYATIEVLL